MKKESVKDRELVPMKEVETMMVKSSLLVSSQLWRRIVVPYAKDHFRLVAILTGDREQRKVAAQEFVAACGMCMCRGARTMRRVLMRFFNQIAQTGDVDPRFETFLRTFFRIYPYHNQQEEGQAAGVASQANPPTSHFAALEPEGNEGPGLDLRRGVPGDPATGGPGTYVFLYFEIETVTQMSERRAVTPKNAALHLLPPPAFSVAGDLISTTTAPSPKGQTRPSTRACVTFPCAHTWNYGFSGIMTYARN